MFKLTDLDDVFFPLIDVDMVGGNQRVNFLKPGGGIGKKSKRVFKVGKRRRQGKGGKVKKRHI